MEKIPQIEYEHVYDVIKTEDYNLPRVVVKTINRYIIKSKEEKTLTHRLILSNLGEDEIELPIPFTNFQGEKREFSLSSHPRFNTILYREYPDLREKDIIKSVAFPNLQYHIAPYGNMYNKIPKLQVLDNLIMYTLFKDDKDDENKPDSIDIIGADTLMYFIVDNIDIFRFLSHNPRYREHMAYYNKDSRILTINE